MERTTLRLAGRAPGRRPDTRTPVLVVDDDEAIRELLVDLLTPNFPVCGVPGGMDAVAQFVDGYYGVALIDMNMPGMKGDEIAERLRDLNPSVVTVLISGGPSPAEKRLLELFDFILPKPFRSLGDVEEMVARAAQVHDVRSLALCG